MVQQAGRLSSGDHPAEKKFNEDSLRYPWGPHQIISIGYIAVAVGDNRDTGAEGLNLKTIAGNYPHLERKLATRSGSLQLDDPKEGKHGELKDTF